MNSTSQIDHAQVCCGQSGFWVAQALGNPGQVGTLMGKRGLRVGSWPWEKEGQSGLRPPSLIAEGAGPSPTHLGELAALEAESERLDQEPWEPGGQEEEEDEEGGPAPAYLNQATKLITQALRDERAGAYPAALQGYRDGVHILLQGVPGEQDWMVEGQAWAPQWFGERKGK